MYSEQNLINSQINKKNTTLKHQQDLLLCRSINDNNNNF